MPDSTRWYQENAREAAKQYEAVSAEDVHGWLKKFLPEEPGRVLDIGAGSGRDAAWFSEQGRRVVAVEPSAEMSKEGKRRHSGANIQWRNDSLPSLSKLSKQEPFDLILVSGVWQHVAESDRKRAFRKIINLLKPDGVLAISLRHGPENPGHKVHPVSAEEVESLARDHGAFVAYRGETKDALGRKGVYWTNLAIRFPDDGTGALPLLRHVILKQGKSATHKLGLLRTLCRIADGAPGIARPAGDGFVCLPMGLVALTWLRLYKPLLQQGLPQTPVSSPDRPNLGFVREAYRRIESMSHLDLRVGERFGEEDGPYLHQALKDAVANIKKMPMTHMTYPGRQEERILTAESCRAPRRRGGITLDEDYLYSFGAVRIKEDLWQALRKHSVWVEPVVISEWSEMIREYVGKKNESVDEAQLRSAMTWSDPERDVQLSRDQAERLLQEQQLYCTWSGKRLRQRSWDIDHCLPWSVWSCGDLWNLMPAHPNVNRHKKRDLLPSESLMDEARDRILDWWDRAYFRGGALQEKFLVEATSSLPGVQPDACSLEEIFESLCLQRAKLRRDQRAPEWDGLIAGP